MKKFKVLMLGLLMSISLVNCADNKKLVVNGKETIVEPYGWMNQETKNKDVLYKVNVGNMVLNVLFFETVIVPIWLTGTDFYEPVETLQK